jgi:hypothetical protein
MSALIRGPHHCVGIATSVAERIFHFLKTRAEAHGGTLSVSDLDPLHAHFLASLPKAANYFEGVDRQYMEAGGATAPELLSHDTILATLVSAVSHKAARTAFPQVEHFGAQWLAEFCGGVARYIRMAACVDADDRLIKVYFELAGRLGAKLVVADLLADDGMQRILRECFAPLMAKGAGTVITERLCDVVNSYIAAQRHIATADPAKITQAETRKFLAFLRSQPSALGTRVAA